MARSGCQPPPSKRHVVVPAPSGGASALTNSRLLEAGSKAISPAIGVGGYALAIDGLAALIGARRKSSKP